MESAIGVLWDGGTNRLKADGGKVGRVRNVMPVRLRFLSGFDARELRRENCEPLGWLPRPLTSPFPVTAAFPLPSHQR